MTEFFCKIICLLSFEREPNPPPLFLYVYSVSFFQRASQTLNLTTPCRINSYNQPIFMGEEYDAENLTELYKTAEGFGVKPSIKTCILSSQPCGPVVRAHPSKQYYVLL